MDPNETLRMIRLYVARINGDEPSSDTLPEMAQYLAEYVEAMDEWLTRGGFLPKDWDHN